MNYVIQDGLNFYELLKCKDDNNTDSICLVSHLPLVEPIITLSCNHAFNYIPLYNEITVQKRRGNSVYQDKTHLTINQIKCPYCRKVHNHLLPYIPSTEVIERVGVNSPAKYRMHLWDCSWIFKSGKRKGQECSASANKTDHGQYCNNHYNYCVKKSNSSNIQAPKLSIVLTEEMKDYSKKHNMCSCKNILRAHTLKLGGRKAEIVKRIFDAGLHNIASESSD